MRCPDCNKFVSFDEPSTDGMQCDIEGSSIEMSGQLVLPCGECGTDLAGADLEDSIDLDDLFASIERQANEEEGETIEYELEDGPDFDSGDTGGSRFKKKFYYVECTGTIKRTIYAKNGDPIKDSIASIEFVLKAKEQASAFDQLC